MKIYVDELPKRCLECGFCCKDDLGYWCQGREDVEVVFIADEMCNEIRLQSCPLQSIAEHDKQVRKQVCNEVLLIIDEKFNCCGYVEEKFEDIKKYVLDKIQGSEE